MYEFDITFLAALGGGAISFLSPCVLPLVPAYLCFITGRTLDELTEQREIGRAATIEALVSAMAFVLGFTTVFVALGASASAISGVLLRHMDVLAKTAGVVIVVFGLHYMGLFRFAFLNREARFHLQAKPPGWLGAFVIGLAFAFGWTPCIGPILGAILSVAASHDDLTYGVSLLIAYSLGLGIPFLAAALGMEQFLKFLQRFRRHFKKVEIVAGVLLVSTGVLIFAGTLQDLSYIMLEAMPWLAKIG
ncbi:MAG: cytochrome c biogenesis CcdA family protein [Sphingomonadales bacterium]